MNYWGAEVTSGKALKVQPGEGKVLHLSQACLGEVSGKGKESVCLFVNIDGQRLVLGTLSSGKLHQQLFDLVFEKDFELSHNWKNGSVYFSGYISVNPFDEVTSDEDSEDSSSDEENMLLEAAKTVKSESEAKEEQPSAAKGKVTEPVKDEKLDESSDDSSSSDESSD